MALFAEPVSRSLAEAGFAVARFVIEAGEQSKALRVAAAIYESLVERRFSREGIVVALGGGVVGDLAGFVASTWMRGVRWVNCPTTVEAMIDAAVGGKTAVNLPGGKNLVGTFHAPRLVLIDPDCLSTLPDRDYRAGWAESVKHSLLESEESFAWHERFADSIAARDPRVVAELIERNVRFKSSIVERDPFERIGARIHLNLGHTLGHAIEECSGYALRHGECVGLGLIAACRISTTVCGLKASVGDRVESLLRRLGLPVRWRCAPPFERIVAAMELDKKRDVGAVRWVLLEAPGRPVVASAPSEMVRTAYSALVGDD